LGDFNSIKRQRNIVTYLIRTAKRNHLLNLANKLTLTKSEKNWWKLVNKLCGLNKSASIPAIECEGVVINAELKADKFNSFFANICQVDESNIREIPVTVENHNILNTIEISRQDVKDQLALLKTDKATGPDNISALLLKRLSNELITPIYILFNQSIEYNTYPSCWKRANVTPIHKKRRTSPSQQLPTSLAITNSW
jgi:hypothetical protein